MRQLRQVTRLLAAALLLAGLSTTIYAQDQEKNKRDRSKSDMITMTGCLTKDAAGGYALTDESTGVKTTVSGPTDLEKHSNHKVTLTGSAKPDATGNNVFEVSKITHVSASCKAPAQ